MTTLGKQPTGSYELPPPPELPEDGLPGFGDPVAVAQHIFPPVRPSTPDGAPAPAPQTNPNIEMPAVAGPKQIEASTSIEELHVLCSGVDAGLNKLEQQYGEEYMKPWATRLLDPLALKYLHENQLNEVFPIDATPDMFPGCAQVGLQYILGNNPDLLPPRVIAEINVGNTKVREALTNELCEALAEADRYCNADSNKRRGRIANLKELTTAASEYQGLSDNRELIVQRANKLHGSEQKLEKSKVASSLGKCALLTLTVPAKAIRCIYRTPAKVATYTAAFMHSRMGGAAAERARHFEEKYGKTTHLLNAAVAIGIVARIGFAFYRAKHGIETGGGNSAMHAADKVSQYASDSGHGNNSPVLEAPSISLVDFETPAPAATDTSDIAPDAVTLGKWGGSKNPSQGTIWGETMRYLDQMGVDTKSLTKEQKGQIVGEMLNHNGLTWEQAAEMSDDAKIKLPSANAMEQTFDKHSISHGEFQSIVEAPQDAPDAGQKPVENGGTNGSQNPQGGDQPSVHGSAAADPSVSAEASPKASATASASVIPDPTESTKPSPSTASTAPIAPHNTAMYYPPLEQELAKAFLESAVIAGTISPATGGLIAVNEKNEDNKTKKAKKPKAQP